MSNKFFSVILLLVTITHTSRAQSESPNPPASLSGASVIGSVQVDQSSATATVAIPLFTIEMPNGATVPIGLSYQTGGIRVNQKATEVGLGWNLSAGGAIYRLMRGLPDDQKEFQNREDYVWDDYEYLLSKSWENKNREKDIFFYTHPGGGGRFVANELPTSVATNTNSYGIPLPYDETKISRRWEEGGVPYWTITDLSGVKYTYGTLDVEVNGFLNENTQETTKTNSTVGNAYQTSKEIEYTSTWYLTSITYPNLPRSKSVKFFYVNGSSIVQEDTLFVETQDKWMYVVSAASKAIKQRNIVSQRLLSKIEFPNGSVEFVYESGRYDGAGNKRLKHVIVKDLDQTEMYKYELHHSYFSSNGSYYKGGELSGCGSPECFRLRLDKITMNGLKYREFEYNDIKLPPTNSYYVDHFGFYNGGFHHGSDYGRFNRLGPANTFEFGEPGHFMPTSSMKKAPSFYRIAGSLEVIRYPTGGHTKLNYSFPDWTKGYGGLEISSIENYDKDLLVSGESYSYEGGYSTNYDGYFKLDIPNERITFFSTSNRLNGRPFDERYIKAVSVTDMKTGSKVRSEFTSFPICDHKFGWITVEGLGFQVNPTISPISTPNNESSTFKIPVPVNLLVWGHKNTEFAINKDTLSLSEDLTTSLQPYVNIYLSQRGVVTKSETWDSNSVRLSETVFSYEYGEDVFRTDNMYAEHVGFHSDLYRIFNVAVYTISSRPLRLVKQESINIIDGVEILSKTDFEYKTPTTSRPMIVRQTDPAGFVYSEEVTYPDDYLGSSMPQGNILSTLRKMQILNIRNIPIESVTKIKAPDEAEPRIASSEVTEFSIVNSESISSSNWIVVPTKMHSLKIKEPMLQSEYLKATLVDGQLVIDEKLVLDQESQFNDQGYEISQVLRNGLTRQVEYNDDSSIKKSSTSSGVSMRSASYEFKPYYGIIKVVDSNLNAIHYEYDQRHRLNLVRDKDGNIVKRYRYHSISDDDTFSGSPIQYTGFNKTGMPLNFSTNNAASHYGQTTYEWNFDNGTTEQTPSPAKVYSYGSAGAYMVQLKMENPEYQLPVTVSRMVNIYDFEAPFGVHGTATYNTCTSGGGGQPINPEGQSIEPPSWEDPDQGSQVGTYFFLGQYGEGAYCYGSALTGIVWEYRVNGGTWVNMNISEPMASLPNYVLQCGTCTIDIRATADIGCGQGTRTAMHTLNVVYQCNTGGGGTGGGTGGGGGTLPPPDEFEPLSPHPGIIQEH